MDTLTGRFGPREIAMGVAFGLLLGLTLGFPFRANLLVVVVALVFFLSHANIAIGLIVAAAVSFFTPWVDPFFHRIGGEILTSVIGQQIGATLFRIPLVPWTMLDNTVVLGSFLVGSVLFFPVFVVVWLPLKLVWPKKKEDETPKTEEKAR